MPISESNEKWYRRKKPLLQIKVLGHIASYGKSTRRLTEKELGSHYADVHEAFKSLENNGLIKPSGETDKNAQQRSSTFYKLTRKGFVAFIDECQSPLEFWEVLAQQCLVTNTNGMQIKNYYSLYERKFLGKHNIDSIFKPSIVEFFDSIFTTYCNDNYERDRKGEALVSRKLIDWLALEGPQSLSQLSSLLKQSKEKVKQTINEFTLQSFEPVVDGEDFDSIIKEYQNFLNHMIICEKNGTVPQYELSLLGVLFALKMKRFGTIFDPVEELLVPQGIYTDMHFSEYLSIVSKNYSNKLPLIFGKWKQLARILRFNVEYILEPIMADVERKNFFNLSVTLGGNKEIYDNLQTIAIDVARKSYRLYDEGIKTLVDNRRYYNEEWYQIIDSILKDLEVKLKYLDLRNYVNKLGKAKLITNGQGVEYEKELEVMEKELGREVTFLTYINLCKVQGFTEEWDIYQSHFLQPGDAQTQPLTLPFQRLLNIDNEIRKEILKWIGHALKEQNEITNKLKVLLESDIT